MERREEKISLGDLSEEQLLDLASLDSFSGKRKQIIRALQNKGKGLSPRAFRLAHPEHQEVPTGKALGGFYDVDGVEVGISLRQLVAIDDQGNEVRSTDYF